MSKSNIVGNLMHWLITLETHLGNRQFFIVLVTFNGGRTKGSILASLCDIGTLQMSLFSL